MALELEFDWDDENERHLAAHRVTPAEVEYVLNNEPLDVAYEMIDKEERYRSVGLTNKGKVLTVVWTIRAGKIRAITAFAGSRGDRKAFLERHR